MKFRQTGLALVLIGFAACDSSANPAGLNTTGGEHNEGSVRLAGTLRGVISGPDSATVTLAGAEIELRFIGDAPADSTPVDSSHQGSVPGIHSIVSLNSRVRLRPLLSFDSIPRDTIPVDTIPVDTIPSDTIPVDTLPGSACGQRGTIAATVTTGTNGDFEINGLAPGLYDIRATPASGSGFGTVLDCGRRLTSHDTPHLDLYAVSLSL